jgi:uncharacterized protein
MIYILILLISVVVGFINTLAGSGSLVMLPILMAMGLPPHIANGTNRVAIFFQSLVGTTTFFRSKTIKIDSAWWAIVPCVLGAVVGAWLATITDPNTLKDLIGVLMIVMLGVIIFKPERWLQPSQNSGERSKTLVSIFAMFLIGIYGGFIQASIGVLLLIGLVLGSNYSLNYANGIKMLIVALYALPVLLVFVWYNQVDWAWGLLTAAGQSIGAYLGAKFAAKYQHADLWTYRLLILVILASIIQFYFL